MSDEPEDLEIPDKTGGTWAALPILGLLEYLFISVVVTGINNKIVDEPIYSVGWWLLLLFVSTLAAANGLLITTGIFNALKSSGRPRCLRINKKGVTLAYTPKAIKWTEIETSFIRETSSLNKGGAKQFLYIVLKRRQVSLNNPFGLKKIMILGRGVYDNEDINNCINMINHFLAM